MADAARAEAPRTRAKTVIEWVVLIVAALVIALVVKAFLFQAFYIPSDSMVPTLKTNDRVIVNKLSYQPAPGAPRRHRRVHDAEGSRRQADRPDDQGSREARHRPARARPSARRTVRSSSTASRSTSRTCPTGTVTDCASFAAQCFPTGPIPADRYWVMGDNRVELARLALLRRDREERDRRPGLRPHLAAQPPRPALIRPGRSATRRPTR